MGIMWKNKHFSHYGPHQRIKYIYQSPVGQAADCDIRNIHKYIIVYLLYNRDVQALEIIQ